MKIEESMKNSFQESPEIDFLYTFAFEDGKRDLEVMHKLLDYLGNPHLSEVEYIHVTGTNGKGSVCASVHSVLKEKYHAGLYLSPHVYRFNERIIVDDKEIENRYITSFVNDFKPILKKIEKELRKPSFFEIITSMAFKYFSESRCKLAIIEVGLGGRLDPTNVIKPLVSAITSIDLEHTHILGNTIESIAYEKAGIIKPGIPVVIGKMDARALQVIEEIARNKGARIYNTPSEYEVGEIIQRLDGMSFKVSGNNTEYKINFPLVGRHQVNNVLIALKILELLQDKYPVNKSDIESGLAKVRLPGRFEIKLKKPLLIFDIAHNPAASRALANTVKDLNLENVTLLFSVLKDKDVDGILRNLSEISDNIVVTEIGYEERRMPAEMIEKCAKKYFKRIKVIKQCCAALEYALESSDVIVATGSAYLLRELEICLKLLMHA
ncbi:MAG: folylpolyglutamate synthase/dihydrofolate synthase family protein [Candidatus Bathyarchaeia archaeon]